jgi:aspartate kinase
LGENESIRVQPQSAFLMRLIVQKYGGTSVGTPERIRNVARRLIEAQREDQGCRVVAIVSAMAGVTDQLIKLAYEMSPDPTKRELDVLLSTGEHAASALTAMAVNALGGRAVSLTGAEAGILTDRIHTRARIANISPKQIQELLAEDYIVVVAGFQGQSPEGETTTLGRGGSDLSAIALAGALNADACQIFTDVDGVFTCDPRVVSDARKLDEIAYDELLEMAGGGAKVMQARAVEFAKKFAVPFEVRSSFHRNLGTTAKEETPSMEDVVVRGISIDRNQAKITIDNVRDEPGIAGRVFSEIARANIVVDMIVQSVGEHGTTDLSFTIHENDLQAATTLLTPVVKELNAEGLITKSGVAKLSVVGIGMRSHSGVAARLFECLGKGGINIQLISTSEIKIAVVIDETEVDRAAQLTHAEFGLARLAPTSESMRPLG